MNIPHRRPVVLVGNALSLMVAAVELAQAGIDVTIVNGSSNWGGHFSIVSCNGIPFDAGLVVHEFTSFKPTINAPDLQTYDPSVKYDASRFLMSIRDYVERYQTPQGMATPQMYIEGRFHDDLLIANALQALPELTFADAIANDLAASMQERAESPLHASRKHQGDAFSRVDFESVSLINHGMTLHTRLIEPFCRKLLDTTTGELVALYHRAAWLPLYYPETLASYLAGTPAPLPDTVFSYPKGERIGDLSGKLKAEIETNGHITVVNDRPTRVRLTETGGYEVDFAERAPITAHQLAWASSPGELLQALGRGDVAAQHKKCSIALAFARVPSHLLRREFTTVSIVDAAFATYRITNQTRCADIDAPFSNLVVEFNPAYARALGISEDVFSTRIADELVGLGIIEEPASIEILKTMQMKNTFTVPSAANLEGSERETSFLRTEHAAIALLGPASGFFTSSFNDQIVQGLQLAARWKR